MNRQCNRSACGDTAAASLSFDYEARAAWLIDAAQPHPATYLLCQRHADALSVPIGWTLHDNRTTLDAARAS